jgi:hypothetical protein
MTYESPSAVRNYERASAEVRNRLSSNLDALSASLTPGRMLDEVLSYSRAGGGDFLKGLGKAAAGNPVPTLLIGVGAALLLSGKGRIGMDLLSDPPVPSTRNGRSDAGSSVGASIKATAGTVVSGVQSGIESATGAVSRTAEEIGRTASATAAKAGDLAASAGAAISGAADSVAGKVGNYAARAGDAVADESEHLLDQSNRFVTQMRDRGAELAREQPLLVAAVGLALGAAVAACLPRTETEDALAGEASDAVKGAFGAVAGEQYEKAKAVAGKVIDDVKTTAEHEGMSPAAAADAVRSLAEKLKAT